jgi:hypothetical protein
VSTGKKDMEINLVCYWHELEKHYKSSLVGSEIIDDTPSTNLSKLPFEWRAGLLVVLPARIYRDGIDIGNVDVLCEVTEVIHMGIMRLAGEVRVSLKVLKPYTG